MAASFHGNAFALKSDGRFAKRLLVTSQPPAPAVLVRYDAAPDETLCYLTKWRIAL